MENLANFKMGTFCEITGLDKKAPLKIRRRLLELGFVPGSRCRRVRKSLLGKAVLVEINGYMLSLRSTLLKIVLVKA